MPSDPSSFFLCISDDFLQLRNAEGKLLGAIPNVPEGTPTIYTEGHAAIPLLQGIIIGAIVPDGIDARQVPGFIPYDGAVRAGLFDNQSTTDGTDSDIAREP